MGMYITLTNLFYTLTLSHSLSLSLFSLSQSLHFLALSLSRSLALSILLSYSLTFSLSHSLALSLCFALSRSFALFLLSRALTRLLFRALARARLHRSCTKKMQAILVKEERTYVHDEDIDEGIITGLLYFAEATLAYACAAGHKTHIPRRRPALTRTGLSEA